MLRVCRTASYIDMRDKLGQAQILSYLVREAVRRVGDWRLSPSLPIEFALTLSYLQESFQPSAFAFYPTPNSHCPVGATPTRCYVVPARRTFL